MQEKIEVKVNGKVVDNIYQEKCLLPSLFSLFFGEIEIMSDDALVKNIETSFSLVEEMGIGTFLSRKIRYGRKLLFDYSRENMIKWIFDTFLAGEGLSTLSGFGMAEVEKKEGGGKMVKRSYLINPEKSSIYGVI